eukprot:TRINITY_DN7094_c0_g1_i1.p1 TRINITY_DN7094_c0_g1~~TRINITY_DN7094_c0_g1_i1.p1  ORF type:complete len:156 (-),score=27.07 TRINITY_DN7094_c0_g1_i1:479-946(-)
MVVDTMKGELHESIAALQGYCAFYHLLLAFSEEYPKIQAFVDDKILEFMRSEEGRMKRSVPNLGEWIVYLSISDKYGWRHAKVARAYLLENFDRHVKWILKKYISLGELARDDPDRVQKSFEESEVSRRLLMFHVYFLKLFRRDALTGEYYIRQK